MKKTIARRACDQQSDITRYDVMVEPSHHVESACASRHTPNALSAPMVAAACALALIFALFATGCIPTGQKSSDTSASTVFDNSTISDNKASSSAAGTSPASANASTTASSSAASSSDSAQSTESTSLDAQVSADIQQLAEASGMQVGVTVIDLSNGGKADYQGDQQMVAASMIKLIIAEAALQQEAQGIFALDDVYTLQASDIVGGTGSLQGLGAGAQVTYRELISKMISESDNVAANVLINTVGMPTINAEAASLGLSSTSVNRLMMDTDAIAAGIENYVSANDVATLLQMIYNGEFVNSNASSLMMTALESQTDRGGVLDGLPAGVTFAHKTGSLSNARHDGGIVEGNTPYVLVVLCGDPGFSPGNAEGTMSQIASATYSDLG